MKYKIISGDPLFLAESITEYLTKGWTLYGNPFLYDSRSHFPTIAQAIVLNEQPSAKELLETIQRSEFGKCKEVYLEH